MSFSSITLEHREKQDHAQKSFLIYALIGSLAIHIGVLAFGLGHLLTDLSTAEDEPIEVTMFEEPTPQVTKPKPPEEKKPPPKVNSGVGGKTQTPARDKTPFTLTVKQPRRQAVPVHAFKPPIQPLPVPIPKEPLVQPSPLEKFVDNFKVPPTQPPKPVAETPQTIPSVTPSPDTFTTPSTPPIPVASPPPTPPPKSLRTLRSLPLPIQTPLSSGEVDKTDTSNSPGNHLISGPREGLNQGSGNGVGNGVGNGIGNSSQQGQRVATVATAPKLPTPKPKPKSTRLNLAKDCIRCDLKYPDTAKQRGIEGSPEVTIDYDENGHVTNVRLTHPSGKSELDQALVEQAREFVLKPVPGGRVGSRVVANFQIRGSERDREYQARQRKREEQAQARQREILTSTPTQEATPGSAGSTPGVITDVPGQPASKRRRRSLTPSTPETPATNPSPQVPRQGVEPSSSNLSAPSDKLNQSPENRSENRNRRPGRLDDSSTQQPFQSPSVPTSQP